MLGIHICGLGRAGRGLLGLARQHGVPVLGTWRGRSEPELPALPDEPHILILAVPDPAVAPLSAALTERSTPHPESVVLHLAARLPGDAARPAPDDPRSFGGFHPLQSFPAEGPLVPGFFVGIGGEVAATRAARELAEALSLPWFDLPDRARTAYHAAAVISSNLLVGLQAVAADAMGAALDQDPDDAGRLLEPLVAGTLSNLAGSPPAQALTGPIARGDASAVRDHLDCLAGPARRAYAALSLALLDHVAERFDPGVSARLRRDLEQALTARTEEL